jgi:hypothetical protein
MSAMRLLTYPPKLTVRADIANRQRRGTPANAYDSRGCLAGSGLRVCGSRSPRYGNWKVAFLKQPAHGFHVWSQPFEELRAPTLTNLRMDPFELAQDIGMDYTRWFLERMFMIAPAAAGVGRWLQSFREFPPRQKPGSFNLERVMEAMTKPQVGAN